MEMMEKCNVLLVGLTSKGILPILLKGNYWKDMVNVSLPNTEIFVFP
jgi:hypothetical protein